MISQMRARAGGSLVSLPLILSYVLDWVIVIAAAVVGAVFSIITPNKRPFSLVDPDISFPYVTKEKISTATLAVCAVVAPAVIIFLITILLVPGPTAPKSTPKALIWRRKLWELHTGWLGLALSLAAAFLITNGMKNLFGKPRPDLLSRCKPDLTNIANYAVGGFSNTQKGIVLVSAAICTNTGKSIMDDGFRSYPSGHSSFSAAGLIYLSLFIASKLAITIPFLAPRLYSSDYSHTSAFPSRIQRQQVKTHVASASEQDKGLASSEGQFSPSGHNEAIIASRNQAAAPPVYLLVFAIIPFFASIYIASTRWSDFRHHGFDILFGYFIGTVTAIFAFRWYHLPISQGAGWSWGPRSKERAFWAGIGVGTYVGGCEKVVHSEGDVEMGNRNGERDDAGAVGRPTNE